MMGTRVPWTEYPNVGVLVLSQHVEPTYAMRLIEGHPERVGVPP